MLLIGITGGIGSGKSTVCRALASMGWPIYYTDLEARRIIDTNSCVRSQVELLFGSDIYVNDRLDRPRVAKAVFADESLLRRLNEVTHPAVLYDVEQWTRRCARSRWGFVESAILHESGLDRLCHKTVLITAPEEVRVARAMQRDGAAEDDVRSRIRNQHVPEQADIIVSNEGTTPVEQLARDIIRRLEGDVNN